MQEHTSTTEKTKEPLTNGTHGPEARAGGNPKPQGGQGEVAAAMGKLLKYLEEQERAKGSGEAIQHRTVVDMAALGDWLARQTKQGAPGENPGSSPVAGRGKPSGQQQPRGKAKGSYPAHQPSQPAKVFSNGDVKTKVWINYQAPGCLTWSVQQVRVYRGPKGEMEARSLRLDDLRDAMRGAYRAERWMRKHERRHRLFGWFLGF